MFDWLAKLMLKTPVQSSGCPCCEGKRQRLEKMRQEIERGEIDEDKELEKKTYSSGPYVVCYKPKQD